MQRDVKAIVHPLRHEHNSPASEECRLRNLLNWRDSGPTRLCARGPFTWRRWLHREDGNSLDFANADA